MSSYIIRRFIEAFFVLIIVSLIIFFIMRLLPGDPILIYIGEIGLDSATPEQIKQMRHEFGLDRPILVQYADWVWRLIHGELGRSVVFRVDVGSMIAKALPKTLHLGLTAFIMSALVGMLAGVISAVRWGKKIDTFITLLANIGICIPIFWLGIMMIYLFSLYLGWLPPFGYTSPFENFWLSTKQSVMPVICLSIFPIAAVARQTRSTMLEVIHQDFIRTAWSTGLKERTIIIKHALKNSLAPVVTLLGDRLRLIIGGTVLIETVYNIPGMGRMAVDAIFGQDYPVVQGVILVISVMVVLSNFIVDISYGWFDPRIRYD